MMTFVDAYEYIQKTDTLTNLKAIQSTLKYASNGVVIDTNNTTLECKPVAKGNYTDNNLELNFDSVFYWRAVIEKAIKELEGP
jgi:hypothetical protein